MITSSISLSWNILPLMCWSAIVKSLLQSGSAFCWGFNLKVEELNNTYWEVETGEYLSGQDIKEIELERDTLIKFLTSKDEAHDTVSTLCKNYEKLCKEKYPEAPLPLEILDIKN